MTTYRAKTGEEATGLLFQPGTIGQDKGDVLAFCPADKIRQLESGDLEFRSLVQDAWLPIEPGNTVLLFRGHLFSVPPDDMEEAFEELQ